MRLGSLCSDSRGSTLHLWGDAPYLHVTLRPSWYHLSLEYDPLPTCVPELAHLCLTSEVRPRITMWPCKCGGATAHRGTVPCLHVWHDHVLPCMVVPPQTGHGPLPTRLPDLLDFTSPLKRGMYCHVALRPWRYHLQPGHGPLPIPVSGPARLRLAFRKQGLVLPHGPYQWQTLAQASKPSLLWHHVPSCGGGGQRH
jgi:hypothetical protein